MLQSAVAGLADSGGAYVMLALCLILVYRTTGVLNFAVAATGTIGTFVMAVLTGHGWAYAPAAVVGVLAGSALSVLFGLALARWFFDSTPAYRATVAIALLIGTVAVGLRVFGDQPRNFPSMVNGNAFTIDGVNIATANVISIVLAFALVGGVSLLLARTRLGLLLRAIAQGPVTAELLALRVRALSVGVWAITGAIATVAILLIAPGQDTEVSDLALLVVPAMGAGLVGSFRRYWPALVGGLVIGAAEGMLSYSQSLTKYQVVIPFAAILLLLLWFERREVWDEQR